MIRVKADSIVNFKDGTFGINVAERILTPAEREVIRVLFPNTAERVYDLLTAEAIVQAIVMEPAGESKMLHSETIYSMSKDAPVSVATIKPSKSPKI